MIIAQTQTHLPTFRIANVLKLASAMVQTRNQRRSLAALDADALKDIGLTRSQVQCEANKPFWDVPQNWTRC